MLRIGALIASFAVLPCQALVPRQSNNNDLPPLKFNDDGAFQICVFSDLHYATDASGSGPDVDRRSTKVIGDVLDFGTPDLVVFNGDLINGEDTYRDNSTHYIDQIVAPLVERNLTWASTYGNHDHNFNINGDDILEREQRFTGSRTQKMVDGTNAGTTNYYLPVYASNCTTTRDCTPELILWFFDSRGGFYYQGGRQHNWVHSSVVEWFNETNAELVEEYGKEIPSLAFVHIPIHASYVFQQQADGPGENTQPGINEEDVVQQGDGWCAEGESGSCDYGDQDLPFMRALVSTPGVIGLFYGHDHGNSWCYKWDDQLPGMNITGSGINLCYGQHTGYGGYGDWIRGGRQIFVTQEGLKDLEIDTHILLESGDVVGSVSLNSTFNTDRYEATPNQKTYWDTASSAPALAMGAGGIYASTLLTLLWLAV
ncbi:Metallophos domain-containing protein [Fusarium falciforme]|uniref:Metallophos domain-containing protein n=1 Tax=Fusarium falciforme TaxID=195108 RepID=UPI0022FFC881|nr:Metallophos domain-containing protein [Fusarium falciforme]WAO91714.1 Metallophos domain-containing protein [Fusarium falciforme]